MSFLTEAQSKPGQPGDPAVPPLVPPAGLVVSQGATNAEVAVTWDAVPGATTYEIARSESNDLSKALTLAGPPSLTTRYLDVPTIDVLHWYWVRAVNESGPGPWSDSRPGSQGSRRWRIAVSGGVDSPPAVGADGTVYYLQRNVDAGVSDLVAASGVDGSERWRRSLNGVVRIPPVLSEEGRVFVSDGKDGVLALSPDGQVAWEIHQGRAQPSHPMALTANGVLIYACGASFVARSAANGDLLFDRPYALAPGLGPVVASDGTLWICSFSGGIVAYSRGGNEILRFRNLSARTTLKLSQDGQLHFADATFSARFVRGDGTTSALGTPFSLYASGIALAPDLFAIPNGTPPKLIFATGSAQVVSQVPAPWSTGETVGLVAAADGTLYASTRGEIVSMTTEGTIQARWQRDGGEFEGAILGDDGTLIVADAASLSAFRASGPPNPNAWAMWRKDRRNSASWEVPAPPIPPTDLTIETSVSVNSATLQWKRSPDLVRIEIWRGEQSDRSTAAVIGRATANQASFTDFSRLPGTTAYYWLRVLNPADAETAILGPVESTTPKPVAFAWQHTLADGVQGPSVGDDGTVYTVPNGTCLTAISADGRLLWQQPKVAGTDSSFPVIGPNGRIHVSDGLSLFAVDPDGSVAWTRPLQAGVDAVQLAISDDGKVYAAGAFGLLSVDLEGRERWWLAHQVFTSANAIALGADGGIYRAWNSSLSRISGDGRIQWSVEHPSGYHSILTLGGGEAIVIRGDGALQLLDSAGQTEWVTEEGESFGAPLVLRTDGGVTALGSTGVTELNPDGGIQSRQTFTADDLVVTANGTLLVSRPYGVDAIHTDGSLAWTYSVQPPTQPIGLVLADDGRIYFGASSNLVALQSELRPAESGWALSRANARRTGQWLPRGRNRPRFGSLQREGGNDVRVSLTTIAGKRYRVEEASDAEDWRTLAEFTAEGNQTNLIWQTTRGKKALLRAIEQQGH